MKQKIEWYKEVLELEPGSRVFFPLAKLLAADGQTSDAVLTLKQGLLRYPDHIEARLLLVELLHLQNAGDELQKELDGLGGLFASYPGFWRAWSERLAQTPALHDASLAMRFFAAALQGQHINWGSVIEHGLFAMLGMAEVAAPMNKTEVAAPQPAAAAPEAAHRQESVSHAPAFDLSAEVREPEKAPDFVIAPVLESAREPVETDAQADDEEEAFSLRTRSMAEILAEQGDVDGALEIYQELMASADGQEKAELAARAEELGRRSAAPSPEEGKGEEKSPPPGAESSRLVSLLESLAQRLEARAR